MLPKFRKAVAHRLTHPIVLLLSRTPITPNIITWLGFLLTLGAAVLIVKERLLAAGFVVLIAGLFDTLDGALARHINRASRFGAILDSTLDRLSEAVPLLGVLGLFLLAKEQSVLFALIPREWSVLCVGLALLGSLLVSYIRARAEAQGLECQVGLLTRPERVVVLALGLLLGQIASALVIVLTIIVVFSFFTVGQRLLYVWQQTKVG